MMGWTFAGVALHAVDVYCADDAIDACFVRDRVDDLGDRMWSTVSKLHLCADFVPLLVFKIFESSARYRFEVELLSRTIGDEHSSSRVRVALCVLGLAVECSFSNIRPNVLQSVGQFRYIVVDANVVVSCEVVDP